MGLVQGEWTFADSAAPPLEAVLEALRSRTGLAVVRDGSTESDWVELPLLRASLLEWQRDPGRIEVRGFIPPHPYLWVQLNEAMASLGGTPSRNTRAFLADFPAPALRRPWAELTRVQRFALRLGPIWGGRPLDRFAFRNDG